MQVNVPCEDGVTVTLNEETAVSCLCYDQDPVIVYLDETSDSPVIIYVAGPPGPPGAPTKVGVVPGSSFTGAPRRFAVVFTTPYVDDAYGVFMSGTDGRTYTYENRTAEGFIINANAGSAIIGEVSWQAPRIGES